MRIIRRSPLFALLAALALAPLPLHADDIPARVPADALLYFQWKGASALGAEYQSSHMKALMDTFGIPKLIHQLVDDKTTKVTDTVKLADIQLLKDLLDAASKSTTTLYVGPVDFANPDLPVPKIAIFADIGKDRAADLAPKIRSLYERNKDDTSPPFTSLQVGDYLVVSIGADVGVDTRLAGPVPTDGLASTDGFKAAIAQLGPNPTDNANLFYLNADATLKVIDDYVASRSTPTTSPWPLIEEALGITELKQIAFTGNFDNQNWTSQAFIGLGEKRAGLLGLLDNPPLDPQTFKLVPENAAWASAFHFDAAKLLDDLRNVAAQTGPRGQQQFDSVLHQFFAFTGVDLKADLFDSMGDTYVFYQSPDAAGKSCNAFTFATPVKNPQKLEIALSTLESVANAMSAQRANSTPLQFKTEPLAEPDEKITAHFIPLDTFTPTWAISNGILYVSSTKIGVQNAVDMAGKIGSITDNSAFKPLFKSLGQNQISSFSFVNFPNVAPEMIAAAANLITLHNTENPNDLISYHLPSAAAVIPDLTSSLRVTWTDAQGWHFKSIGPFPYSTYLAPQNYIIQYFAAQEEQHRDAQNNPPQK